jgi:predicted adenylyl cyclase CyaB
MEHINIEIKAKCADQGRIRSILKSRNAEFRGLDHQVDTYFKVSAGRLKLREGNIENHLIFYERANQQGPKQSNVILFDTEPKSAVKEILAKALGVLFVVDKSREIYFIENVKFHLDAVKDLGTFVEIEAIDTGGITKEKLDEQCRSYMQLFGIKDSDLLAVSYSDLLLEKQA